MDPAFLASLSCPYCRGGLGVVERLGHDEDLHHAIVACPCYEYPLVDGILVLRQLSGPSDTIDEAVVALRDGDPDRARAWLQTRGSMVTPPAAARHRAADVIRRGARHAIGRVRRRLAPAEPVPTGEGTPLGRDLEAMRPGGFATYLYLRAANPSFAAAVPLFTVLGAIGRAPDRMPVVLDLGCGIGHSTALLRALYPEWQVVAAEPDFVNLQLLRRHFDRTAVCVCMDAELPLPFADDTFEAVVCLDAFHYIRAKYALARELDRVVRPAGVWLLPHLHNAAASNVSPGIPLRAEDYLRVVGRPDAVLLDESSVLERFARDRVVDLSAVRSGVPDAAAFSLVAGGGDRLWRVHQAAEALLSSPTTLGPNPIFRAEVAGDRLELVREWPDPWLARECAQIECYLPASTSIELALLDRLASGQVAADDHERLLELVSSFVLVHLPPGYRAAPPTGAG